MHCGAIDRDVVEHLNPPPSSRPIHPRGIPTLAWRLEPWKGARSAGLRRDYGAAHIPFC